MYIRTTYSGNLILLTPTSIERRGLTSLAFFPSQTIGHPVVYRHLLISMPNILMVTIYSFDVMLARMPRRRIRTQTNYYR